MSIIGPILIASLWAIPIWLATRDTDQKTIEVIDESGFFAEKLLQNSSLVFIPIDKDLATAKENISSSENYGLLYIPKIDIDDPKGITFFSGNNPSLEVIRTLKGF
jgi:ABC-2 type transport system permease protein